VKDTVETEKYKATDSERTFAKPIPDKGLVSRT
jgi:hypothetical protein